MLKKKIKKIEENYIPWLSNGDTTLSCDPSDITSEVLVHPDYIILTIMFNLSSGELGRLAFVLQGCVFEEVIWISTSDGNRRIFHFMWNIILAPDSIFQQVVGQGYFLHWNSYCWVFDKTEYKWLLSLDNPHSVSPYISSIVWAAYKVLHYFSVRWVSIINNFSCIIVRIKIRYLESWVGIWEPS